MGSPAYKVYSSNGSYVAACEHAEAALTLAAAYGGKSTIRWKHGRILWRQHRDKTTTLDHDASLIRSRIP